MGRPRGKNYEKNLYYRTPKEIREKVFEKGEKQADPSKMQTADFVKTPLYSFTKSFVNSVVEINNNAYQKYKEAKDPKKIAVEHEPTNNKQKGIMYRPGYRIPVDDLRWLSYSSSLIGSIHQVVTDDATIYSSYDSDPGFIFKYRDRDDFPSDISKQAFKDKAQFLTLMGTKDFPDWRERDRLKDIIEMSVRDILTIDSVAFMRTYNKRGELIDIRYIDPATVFRVDSKHGYKGDQNITHVQSIDYNIVETFERGRMVYRNKTTLSDIRFKGFGFSPLESCVTEILGMLNALRTNSNRWNDTNPPKVMAYTKANVSDAVKQSMQLQWEESFSGNRSRFKLPILFGMDDLNVQKLEFGDDMEFDKFLQFTASLIITRHGVDPAVIGLKLNQSQALSEPSTDGRQKFSRDRSHGAMMGFLEDTINELIDPQDEKPYIFKFKGVKSDEEEKKAELFTKQYKVFKNLDQILIENDMPTTKEIAEDYLAQGIISEEEAKKLAKIGLFYDNQYVGGKMGEILFGGEEGAGMGMEGEETDDLNPEDYDLSEFDESGAPEESNNLEE